LIKTDSKGTLKWEGIYGIRHGEWAGEDACLTKDGGALVANDCGQFGFTKIKPFLMWAAARNRKTRPLRQYGEPHISCKALPSRTIRKVNWVA